MNPDTLNHAVAMDEFLIHNAILRFFIAYNLLEQDLLFNDDNIMLIR